MADFRKNSFTKKLLTPKQLKRTVIYLFIFYLGVNCPFHFDTGKPKTCVVVVLWAAHLECWMNLLTGVMRLMFRFAKNIVNGVISFVSRECISVYNKNSPWSGSSHTHTKSHLWICHLWLFLLSSVKIPNRETQIWGMVIVIQESIFMHHLQHDSIRFESYFVVNE